ncbi:DUF5666 domain-containing protein [Nocardia miyunensis]|uniref:DUF5666 domain-containing protein n=1 Tax=Nocardia miyunensis TaxID=282684 RepID=UPI000837A7CC|nr:DUF5666 domain-containing protein [Nocardia miyunensis]
MTAPEQPQRPEQPEHAEPTWGAPQTTPSTWNTRKTIATVGIAAAIAAVGGGVIYAASGNSSEHGGRGGPGGGPGWSMNGPGGQGGANAAGPGGANGGAIGAPTLHGQFVISDGNGGYTTELTQTGTVTAISADSITAKSTDDYSHTYTINTSTQSESGLKVGDTVSIRATDANGTATATVITEPSANQNGNGLSRRNSRMSMHPGGADDDTSGDPNQMPSMPGQFGPGGMGPGPGTQLDAQAPTTN